MANEFTDFSFWKIEGAGNDFAVLDLREPGVKKAVESVDQIQLVKKLSTPKFGLGCDGVVFIKDTKTGEDFQWDFFNADGSRAEMCGNAARCIGLVGMEFFNKSDSVNFLTDIGPVEAKKAGDLIEVAIEVPSFEPEEFDVGLMNGTRRSWFINTGVPHVVIESAYWPIRKELKPKIESIRNHPRLGEAGANVTLYKKEAKDHLNAITFERGVEDYTLSCGTGVMAAAIVDLFQTKEDQIDVSNPGGRLNVRIDQKNNKVYLKGPARIVYKGQLNKDFFNNEV